MVDVKINWTLCMGEVRKPRLPGVFGFWVWGLLKCLLISCVYHSLYTYFIFVNIFRAFLPAQSGRVFAWVFLQGFPTSPVHFFSLLFYIASHKRQGSRHKQE